MLEPWDLNRLNPHNDRDMGPLRPMGYGYTNDIYGGFLELGYPQSSSIYRWILPQKHQPAIGDPPFFSSKLMEWSRGPKWRGPILGPSPIGGSSLCLLLLTDGAHSVQPKQMAEAVAAHQALTR